MSESTGRIKVQAELTGYFGPSVNLLGMLDTNSGFMIVAKELPVGERVDGALVITNSNRGERDRLFTEDDLQASIRQFFSARSMKLLELLAAVQKHDPGNRIQTTGVNERGTRYELSNETTNGNVAVLAMTFAANLSMTAEAANDMASEMTAMFLSI
jgi:hypothetical protein